MVISMGGIGPDGHIAFNESGSSFVKIIKKISHDFNQLLAKDYVKIKLGPDWKKIIATFEE